MSKILHRALRGVFVLGVAGALSFGAQAVFAADRVTTCPCDPDDPDADEFCSSVQCCDELGSVCTQAEICICA